MFMQRTITAFLLVVGVAVAAPQTGTKRVRRGLINVQKQQADEKYRLTNEFGEGDRDLLQEEEMERMMQEDMSFPGAGGDGMSFGMGGDGGMSFGDMGGAGGGGMSMDTGMGDGDMAEDLMEVLVYDEAGYSGDEAAGANSGKKGGKKGSRRHQRRHR